MRETTIPESGSKRKLLEAAEGLIAQKGFEAVSVRDITELAQTNVASVNYHFGNREALMNLVMLRYMTPIHEERLARLDALERKWSGKGVPLEEIIDALVRPLTTQLKKTELAERMFYKLIGRIFALQENGLPGPIDAQFQQVLQRFTRAFAKTLPTVAADELAWRIHFMVGGMIHSLTHQEIFQRLGQGAAGPPTMEVALVRFVRFSAAGMREGIEVETPAPRGPQVMFDF